MTKRLTIKLFPGKFDGEIKSPPSKSLSHRSLICASLSTGRSIIKNITLSDDIVATISALEILGAKFQINANTVTVNGIKRIKNLSREVNCNESGSTLRFLIPLFSLSNRKVTFTGAKSLLSRPQYIYEEIFKIF